MYRDFENPEPPKYGRMFVDREPPDMGPPRKGDTVTVGVAPEIELYIVVQRCPAPFIGRPVTWV